MVKEEKEVSAEVNPVDMETNSQPEPTPLDGVAENVKEAETKVAELTKQLEEAKVNYSKLVKAFNNLMDEYNNLHVQMLLLKADK